MRIASLVLPVLAAVVIGCTSLGPSAGGRETYDRDRITREQLEGLPASSAMEAVERFHRNWLRSRGSTLTTSTGRVYPEVFVDGRHFGPLDSLLQFGTETIQEIRFISASDATTRFGTGYPGGIIELILRRGGG